VASTWGLAYFFDHTWPHFLQWLGSTGRWLLEHAGWSVAVLVALSAAGMLLTLRAREPEQRRMARLTLAVWLGYAAFYTLRGLSREPHYQFPSWWVVAVGVAGALHALHTRSPRWGTVATALVLGAAGVQFLVNVAWMGYVRQHGGTQGVHYSTPLGAQQEMIRRVCEETPGPVSLESHTVLFPHSLSYVAKTTPACRNVALHICGAWGGCPPGTSLRRLRYAAPVGGALVLE
jgi:hypothetical protein